MSFSNPLTQLILPNGANPTVGPVIFLDGTTGQIIVIGVNGGKIVIDPNVAFPQLHFFSNDGTNDAFINAVSTGSNVDLGINSGVYTPADGVPRRGRLFLDDSANIVDLAIINAANQARQGGWLRVASDGAFCGFDDPVLAGGPYHAYWIYSKNGAILQIQNAGVTSEFNFNTVRALFDGDFILHQSTAVFMRNLDIINPLHFQADQRCNAGTTITSTVASTLPGTSVSFITSIATAKVSVQMTCDMSVNIAGTTGVGQLVVDGALQQGQAIFSGAVAQRATVTQTYEITLVGAGTHSFRIDASVAGAGQSMTFNAIHTKLGIRIYE